MSASFDEILGHAPGGEPIGVVRLAAPRLRVAFANYGARLLSMEAPDRDGHFDHVLLGFDDPAMILKAGSFNAVLGRYANRIAGARFTLDGKTYELSRNDGDNTLHGGARAFAKLFWTLAERTPDSVSFSLHSPDGDQGFPGAIEARVTYTIADNALSVRLEATTSAATPLNLSTHPYFNLGGRAALDICDHTLQVAASRFLPTDARQIPTGELRPVAGTPFDFRQPEEIGSRIRTADPQMLVARGFDHCFVVYGESGTLRPAARLVHPPSGRVLDLATDRAGLQVYTSNSLDGSLVGHGGTYRQTAGLALEAQAFPDSPNQPAFPTTIVGPGQTFRAETVYTFSVT